jgi:hypothetical protein
MTLFKKALQDHLTAAPVDVLARASHAGMAHFAGTGPAGETCRDCLFWAHGRPNDYRAKGGHQFGLIESATCNKYRTITLRAGNRVPGDAMACRYFRPNRVAPERSGGPTC